MCGLETAVVDDGHGEERLVDEVVVPEDETPTLELEVGTVGGGSADETLVLKLELDDVG